MVGILALGFIWLFQNITNTDEQNYYLLKEVTESAMIDAFDLAAYRKTGYIKIDREKFVENFIRRFAEEVNLGHTYQIDIYDVNEIPPKVSLKVTTLVTGNLFGGSEDTVTFNIQNKLDAILEIPY